MKIHRTAILTLAFVLCLAALIPTTALAAAETYEKTHYKVVSVVDNSEVTVYITVKWTFKNSGMTTSQWLYTILRSKAETTGAPVSNLTVKKLSNLQASYSFRVQQRNGEYKWYNGTMNLRP